MRLLILEEQRVFAQALGALLASEGVVVFDPVPLAADALAAAERLRPDVALVDLRLPDADDLAARLAEFRPEMKIVALGTGERFSVPEFRRRRYHGCVSKDVSAAQFVEALRSICDGRSSMYISAAREKPLVEWIPGGLAVGRLTVRELDVLGYLVEGASNGRITRELHLSTHTVRGHVQNILVKLNVHSRLEAVAFAARHGLVGPSVATRPRVRWDEVQETAAEQSV